MIRFYFNFNLNFISKHRGTEEGWGSTFVEFGSRLGWNFFTRTRYWNKDTTELLPPVTKLRLREVNYYHEVEDKVWNFMEKRHDTYWKFEDRPQKEGGPHLRMTEVVYRLPLITITTTYHTKLDEKRHREFLKELDREQSEHIVDRIG